MKFNRKMAVISFSHYQELLKKARDGGGSQGYAQGEPPRDVGDAVSLGAMTTPRPGKSDNKDPLESTGAVSEDGFGPIIDYDKLPTLLLSFLTHIYHGIHTGSMLRK